MIYNYEDYQILNESLVNEAFSFQDIKDMVNRLKDKDSAISHLITKYNSSSNLKIKKNIAKILAVIFILTAFKFMSPSTNASEVDNIADKITDNNTLTVDEIKSVINKYTDKKNYKMEVSNNTKNEKGKNQTKSVDVDYNNIFKDPLTLRVSSSTKQFIKEHEKLRLKAYELGDGKITIGYGHSEPKSTSKYKVGDVISKDQAVKLFNKDLQLTADAVRRMFKQWKDEGVEVKITQNMFDAIISMVYNIGITRFRNTELAEHIKRGDLAMASTVIEDTVISEKFPGLKDRRASEYKLFIRDYLD